MTLEQFNLHITTPEGEEKDPELIRLRAELMAIKPLLDDAIQRESVSEAEELHKQALEAKAKLEAYKEKGISQIEINKQKLELGPTLGEMSWLEIPAKLEELNKTLKPGEKPWRVPTVEEYEEIVILSRAILDDKSIVTDERIRKLNEWAKSLGMSLYSNYWTSEDHSSLHGYALSWRVDIARKQSTKKMEKCIVRCIR